MGVPEETAEEHELAIIETLTKSGTPITASPHTSGNPSGLRVEVRTGKAGALLGRQESRRNRKVNPQAASEICSAKR